MFKFLNTVPLSYVQKTLKGLPHLEILVEINMNP